MKSKLIILLFMFCLVSVFSQRTVGLITQLPSSQPGYLFFAPLNSKSSFLIDKCGKMVHSWTSNYYPGQCAYLLRGGELLRTANDSNKVFNGGGGIEKFNWNNELIWSYFISDTVECQHHDIYPMPNGNILVLVWEKIAVPTAVALGRDPNLVGTCIWSEKIVELKPLEKNKAQIVWKWRAWDHLVQAFDSTKLNFAKVSKHPELININFLASKDNDWLHFNSLAYNQELDQIVVSNRNFSEVFILDHSTSITEASGHRGGRQGRGGDLLYRWGNPRTYDCGSEKDQQLFRQHSAHWIEKGLADEGKILVFNNGLGRKDSMYSSVEMIVPPVSKKGSYEIKPGQAFLPFSPVWSYHSELKLDFFSKNVSNAQRLPNGNMLVSSGANGTFFELDSKKNTVWKYICPIDKKGIVEQGKVPVSNLVFRCVFYDAKYLGINSKDLKPGKPIELGTDDYPCQMK